VNDVKTSNLHFYFPRYYRTNYVRCMCAWGLCLSISLLSRRGAHFFQMWSFYELSILTYERERDVETDGHNTIA